MKNISISLTLAVITFGLFTGICFGQNKVIDATPEFLEAYPNTVPDVMGKVLIDETINTATFNTPKDGFTLYTGWPLQFTGSSSRGGVYCNLDGDDELEIVYSISQQVHAFNIDGSPVNGWPVSVQLYPDGAPAFGDIDGDGVGEIVVSTRAAGTGNTGKLHAFNIDGSAVSGFPINLSGGATKTPVLADLDADGIYEIVLEERDYPDGYVGVYKGNGASFPGFPVMLDYIPGSAVAVGDITGDGIPEIVAQSYYSILAFDNAGNMLDGFPFAPGTDRVFSYSSPVLADIDGDGYRDIIAGDHSLGAGNGAIHVIDKNGNSLAGWPKFTSYWIYGPAAVGDIDGDGSLDIAVGDQVLAGSPSDKVYAWDKDGNALAGWPTNPMNAINNQIILADLDGDNMVELMWDDNTGNNVYIGYNHDGTPMDNWPLTLDGSSFFMNPFATDVNGDGNFDVSGGGNDLATNELYFYLWDAGVPVNPAASPLTILQYNTRHDGVYVDASMLNADFSATPVTVCKGETVQFTDLSTGNPDNWQWTFEGGTPASSTDQNPQVVFADSGTFDVELTVSDGSNTNAITKTDYMQVADDPVIPDQPIGPYYFNTDTANFTFYSATSANAIAYNWQLIPDDVGLILEGDTVNQVKVYWSTDENYSAELQVRAENVCGLSEYSEPLMIYVNWTTSIEKEKTNKLFTVFPNPANGKFHLQMKEGIESESILLYSAEGKLLQTIIDQSKVIYDFDVQDAGLYILEINIAGKIYTEKIVVRQ